MAPHGKHGHHQQAYAHNYPNNNNQQAYNQGGGYGMQNYNQGGATTGGYNQPYNSPPAYGGAGGQQDGYYGGQQYGVQTPAATYQQSGYAPPQGPPPGK